MSHRSVGTIGSGPAIEAATAALEDVGHDPVSVDPEEADAVDLVVVAGTAGDERFARVDARCAGPWLAVELGGVGGMVLDAVEASTAVLHGNGPCYRCLGTRVRSTTADLAGDAPRVAGPTARLAGAQAGRLAVEVLAGSDPVGTLIELPHAERRLWPVPGCSCGGEGGRVRRLVREHEAVTLDQTVDRAEAAVDARLGPVVSVGEAESFPAPYYLAAVADTSGFSDAEASQHAAGVAADWNPAFVKAVGEALERYAAGVYRTGDFAVAPAAALDGAVSPARFVRPDDATVGPDEPIAWVPGEVLATGEPVQLPAERVQFPPPAERLGPAITTGLGLGTSGPGALVSGVTEVIERDATMLAWYSTFEPLGLAVDDAGFDALARRARAEDLAVSSLLVTQDIDVPVVTVAVHREGDWPRFAVGSGAAIDPEGAARGALEEALQNWMELRGMGRETAAEDEPRIARYAAFPREARALIDVDTTVPATRVGPDGSPAGAEALDVLVERVAAAGLESYGSRLTTRDLEAIGFEAVRVVIPAAQPLFTGERYFGERARTVPRELGFRPRLDRPPHPYP